jgi:hypothetical protein
MSRPTVVWPIHGLRHLELPRDVSAYLRKGDENMEYNQKCSSVSAGAATASYCYNRHTNINTNETTRTHPAGDTEVMG